MSWRKIETAPRDGSEFIALQFGYLPAFVIYQRPNRRLGRKRWFVVGSQGSIYGVDDLASCDEKFTHWRPMLKLPESR